MYVNNSFCEKIIEIFVDVSQRPCKGSKKKWITQTNYLKFHFFLRNILIDTCFFLLIALHLTPYTLHPTLYTLHLTPYTLHSTPYTLHFTLYTLHSTPYTKQYLKLRFLFSLFSLYLPLFYREKSGRRPSELRLNSPPTKSAVC